MTSELDSTPDNDLSNGYVLVDASSEESEDFEHVEDEIDELEDQPYYEKTVKEIEKGDRYPCMICTVEMDFTCHMYACPDCYRVFDFECIREWALKSTQKSVSKTWKCPNCYFERKEVPMKNRPTCWCGKSVQPEPNPLNPNSCGQTCDAQICEHGCSSICHLGPHPTCMRMVQVKCKCGKKNKSVFCHEAGKFVDSFICDSPCGLTLPCGIHKCQRKCHSGICGECPESIYGTINCYCKLESKPSLKCTEVRIEGRSRDSSGNKWVGAFSCENIRTVEHSCKKHSFAEPCKAPPSISGQVPCPFSPRTLKTCPCGRSPLREMDVSRSQCTDPIPTCDSVCGKMLRCGKHKCPFKCHTGSCMEECLCTDKVKCSCHARQFIVPCKFQEKARCNTKCEALMSCRRHRCIERCCDGRSLAQSREKKVFLTRDKLDESLVEAQHICLKQCNLKLSCGKHFCKRKCHPGNCAPCLESDSNDLVCPCGKTVVPAPVRCGTVLPRCLHPCIKTLQGPAPCGHPPMPHPCHPLEEPCPSCTAPVFKSCKCRKNDKVRTLCFQNDVSCGRVCGKQLAGCQHICQKACHKEGECQTSCKQPCGKTRENCEHRCRALCHSGTPCPDKPCVNLVDIKCNCGHRSTTVTCGANENRAPAEETALECNNDCDVARRHQELMEAFGIKNDANQGSKSLEDLEALAEKVSTFQELLLPFSEATLSVYSKQTTWCTQIEECLERLMNDKTKPSLHFKPMRPPQRHFIHELGQAYHLYCESQDQEPKRSVFVKKTADSQRPSISLKVALPLYYSFKSAQRERKLKETERHTTTRIINYAVTDQAQTPPAARFNGLLVQNVLNGINEKAIQESFSEYLKHTLLKDPHYLLLTSGDVLVYCDDYSTASVNVENDIERIVGHLDHIVKEQLLAEGVYATRVQSFLDDLESSTSDAATSISNSELTTLAQENPEQ